MHKIGAIVFLTAMVVMAGFSTVKADDTGFAYSHTLKKERGRLCMYDHFHYGSSSGHRSKKIALREAMRSWQDFTAFEYGGDWAGYRRAAQKEATCKKYGPGWGCDVSARPCKRPGKRRRRG